MVWVVRSADGCIKGFLERAADLVLEPGETCREEEGSFAGYAARLRLAVEGRSGETLRLPAGSGDVTVVVTCPGESGVLLEVNGVPALVALAEGCGELRLSRAVPGVFLIRPAERARYCAAGGGVLTVEVLEAEEEPV